MCSILVQMPGEASTGSMLCTEPPGSPKPTPTDTAEGPHGAPGVGDVGRQRWAKTYDDDGDRRGGWRASTRSSITRHDAAPCPAHQRRAATGRPSPPYAHLASEGRRRSRKATPRDGIEFVWRSTLGQHDLLSE